jgi:hypothetical protein
VLSNMAPRKSFTDIEQGRCTLSGIALAAVATDAS